MTKDLKAGDHVTWETSQGETSGKVVKKETSTTKVGGHTAVSYTHLTLPTNREV